MIWLVGIEAFVILILVVLHQREIAHWKEIVWNMGAREAQERTKLLDRIQHPELRQVPPGGEMIEYDPPKDAAELAQVGQVVPEFVQVGDNASH
jgi:hypothetical protein